MVKCNGLTVNVPLKLQLLSSGEESGIPGVAVECIDIWKNTKSEGSFLAMD